MTLNHLRLSVKKISKRALLSIDTTSVAVSTSRGFRVYSQTLLAFDKLLLNNRSLLRCVSQSADSNINSSFYVRLPLCNSCGSISNIKLCIYKPESESETAVVTDDWATLFLQTSVFFLFPRKWRAGVSGRLLLESVISVCFYKVHWDEGPSSLSEQP